MESIGDSLGDGQFLLLLGSILIKVVVHDKCLFLRSQSLVTGLGKLRVLLMLGLRLLTIVEEWTLLHVISPVDRWDYLVGSVPSLLHQKGRIIL